MAIRSTGASSIRTGSLPSACTASVWKTTPASRQRAPISSTGWMVPTSLFTHITETTHGSSRRTTSSASISTLPSRSTGSV
jgi:hypothetical protein